MVIQPDIKKSLHLREIFKFLPPATNFSLPDEVASLVKQPECLPHLVGVDRGVVPEVLDVEVLNELLLLLLGEGTVEERTDFVNDRAEVSLHILVKTEKKEDKYFEFYREIEIKRFHKVSNFSTNTFAFFPT